LLIDRAGELTAPVPVVVEAAWFIEDRFGAEQEADFLALFANEGAEMVDLTAEDWQRCGELVRDYADLGLGTVDASLIAVAERLSLTELATMNGRDFLVVRPKHCVGFTLLPAGIARP
jgi:predicted nucleic acid-binding protein